MWQQRMQASSAAPPPLTAPSSCALPPALQPRGLHPGLPTHLGDPNVASSSTQMQAALVNDLHCCAAASSGRFQ